MTFLWDVHPTGISYVYIIARQIVAIMHITLCKYTKGIGGFWVVRKEKVNVFMNILLYIVLSDF